ncbi:MAG: RNA polymerase sigma factor [Porticoccaceae bacterium]|nr:RNA polymerase sigma factor [Porticoccaceae bacterium]
MMAIAISNPELTAAELELDLLLPEPQSAQANNKDSYTEVNVTDKRHSKNNSAIAENVRIEQAETNKTMPELIEMSMDEFLQSIERRAFHMARMATGSRDDALDIVQDAMFKLVQKYADKSADEWRPLFYRILNRKITDHYRRNAVKNRLFSLASFGMKASDEGADLIDRAEGRESDAPDRTVARALQMEILSKAVAQLPGRQRQAFMLRCWDGMSTAITAETMGCSQGSVKTHYSRAIHSLRASLEDYHNE